MLCVVYSNKISSYRTKLASLYRMISTCKHYANIVHPYLANKMTYICQQHHMCIPAKAQTFASLQSAYSKRYLQSLKKDNSSSSHVTISKWQKKDIIFFRVIKQPTRHSGSNPSSERSSFRRDGGWHYLSRAIQRHS